MIRVLVVDDSITVRQRLVEIIAHDPELEVVGEVGDGKRAIELAESLRPDVITLDIVMPQMSGLAATEQIMAHHPTPILIVSSSFNRGDLFDTYSALAAGAVDVFEKPGLDDLGWEQRFIAALKMVARIKVITHPRARLGALGRSRGPSQAPPAQVRTEARSESAPLHSGPVIEARSGRRAELIALGASTGGPGALSMILGSIPSPCAIPILVVLHLDAPFAVTFADWLASQTRHSVRVARDGELIDHTTQVLLAPAGCHTLVEHRRIRLTSTPPRNHCRPSIDVLFESLSVDYGDRLAACILTGMGRDGAAGLLAIRRSGGMTFGQDELTSVIYGMPREAMQCGAVERELPLPEIGRVLGSLGVKS